MALKILVYTATLVSHEVPSEGVQIGERRCNLSGNRLSHRAGPRLQKGDTAM